MKNFRWWPAIGVVTAVVALAGCGGGGDDESSNASMRVVNATRTHASIDLLVNSVVAAAATASDTLSAYTSPASGSVTLQINDAGAGTALATSVPTLTGGNHYTMVVYESGSTVKTVILNEDFVAPTTAGVATLRLYDLAPEAGKLDVYVTTNTCSNLTGVSPSYSFVSPTTTTNVSLTQGAGTYNVCVTAQGSVNDLRLSQSITVASQQVATVVMTPTSGGQLLNGALLVQQGAYTASRNPNSRVRLAAAVTGSNAVALSAAGATVDTLASPGLSFQYKLVPAASALSGTIGGIAFSTASKPAVGDDVTLLVYGDPAAPTVTLLTDDNRLPTDGSTRMRLINGITGNVGALTLTANGSVIGTGIAPGAASGYASPTLSTTVATTLKLVSTTSPNLLSDSSNVLSPNAVYTILAGGDVSVPASLLLLVR